MQVVIKLATDYTIQLAEESQVYSSYMIVDLLFLYNLLCLLQVHLWDIVEAQQCESFQSLHLGIHQHITIHFLFLGIHTRCKLVRSKY